MFYQVYVGEVEDIIIARLAKIALPQIHNYSVYLRLTTLC